MTAADMAEGIDKLLVDDKPIWWYGKPAPSTRCAGSNPRSSGPALDEG